MKKITTFCLALLLTLALAGQALAFTDIDACGAEMQQAINGLAEQKILNGYIDETFRPYDSINRAEFAKVASAALILKNNMPLGAVQELNFSDVPKTAWYVKDVANAVALGLMRGDAEGTFRPNDTVSEAEVLTVLVRSLGYTDDELLKLIWPENYLAKAGELGLLSPQTSVFNPNAACTRGQVAVYVARMLQLPQKGEQPEPAAPAAQTSLSYDYGVVTSLNGDNITIASFDGKGTTRTYKLAADCDWRADRSECGEGRLVYFGVNADKLVVSMSRKTIYTHSQHEAELNGAQIKLNGKNLLLDDNATVLLMNSGGGVVKINMDKLLASSYVADLRSTAYHAPLQYVSVDGKNVTGLLIGDYRGQNGLQFGFLEEYGTGSEGLQVKFYGDPAYYEWHYDGPGAEQSPQVDVLYAYTFRASGVYAYPVGRRDEEIHGVYGEGEIVRNAGDICYTMSGTPFIVSADTVIMQVSVRADGSIYKVDYIDAVYGGDRVCVRYTKKTGSNYTGIEAAYILVIDAIEKDDQE